jgi:broad specificity phosphatase PhoE
MNTLILIRHGETQSNREGIFRGRLDIPLSEAGIEQANELHRHIQHLPVDAVFSSPLKRALKTADIAFPNHNIECSDHLNNLDLGDWSGQDKGKIAAQFPDLWHTWIKTPEKMKFPNGESLDDVYKRAESFLHHIRDLNLKCCAAVSHRSVTKVIIAAAIGLSENYFWKFHLDNCSVTRLMFDQERDFTIFSMNETHFMSQTIQEWY